MRFIWLAAGIILRPLFYFTFLLMALLGKISFASLMQRTGFIIKKPQIKNKAPGGRIWIHLASVGEFNTARAFIKKLSSKRSLPLILTCTNEDTVRAAEKSELFEAVLFLPVESPLGICRLIRAWNVRVYLGFEVEIWPVMLAVLSLHKVKSFLLGAYLYDEVYKSYRRFNFLFKSSFKSFSGAACRSKSDLEKLSLLGIGRKNMSVCGDLKYDLDFPSLSRTSMRRKYSIPPDAHLLVMGSLHPGEEKILAVSCARMAEKDKKSFFIFAPRNLTMTALIEKALKDAGISFRLRTDKKSRKDCRALILNTIGELREVYAASDLAFVGGSLVEHGGHNFLEPVFYGVTTFCGNDIRHFADIHAEFSKEVQLVSPAEVSDFLIKNLPSKKNRVAQNKLSSLRGAGGRMLAWLLPELL